MQRSSFGEVMLILSCASVAACAALAVLVSLTTAPPPGNTPATLSLAVPTPPAWPDNDTNANVPAASVVFAVKSGESSSAQPASPTDDEAVPTF